MFPASHCTLQHMVPVSIEVFFLPAGRERYVNCDPTAWGKVGEREIQEGKNITQWTRKSDVTPFEHKTKSCFFIFQAAPDRHFHCTEVEGQIGKEGEGKLGYMYARIRKTQIQQLSVKRTHTLCCVQGRNLHRSWSAFKVLRVLLPSVGILRIS